MALQGGFGVPEQLRARMARPATHTLKVLSVWVQHGVEQQLLPIASGDDDAQLRGLLANWEQQLDYGEMVASNMRYLGRHRIVTVPFIGRQNGKA